MHEGHRQRNLAAEVGPPKKNNSFNACCDSMPVVTSYLVWDGGQWRHSVSSARVDPALNGTWRNLEKLTRKGVLKHRIVGPQPPIALPG